MLAMPRAAFRSVETWVFDLDNTLYPPESRLFDQIERHMTTYVMACLGVDDARASRLRGEYWREYGTTLAGLMARHGVDPDPFLAAVHDIDLSKLAPAPELAAALDALPGRKIVYTNGSREHARRVTAALGLAGALDALYGIEDAGYLAKPHAEAFTRVFAADGLDPRRAAMFEDDPRNLRAPHGFGMRTVLVGPGRGSEQVGAADLAEAHIHHHTADLAAFLAALA